MRQTEYDFGLAQTTFIIPGQSLGHKCSTLVIKTDPLIFTSAYLRDS